MCLSLFLIGMRGAGKSVAGRAIATRLSLPFLDADAEVERRAGRTILQIFADEGEVEFRRHERDVMVDLLGRDRAVVATGGGCILDSHTRQGLRSARGVVWLDAPVTVLASRVAASSERPSLLGDARPELEIPDLARSRAPLYDECADLKLDTAALSIEEVTDAIEHFWTHLSRNHLR